jgi:SAM-dependent methyltransferase
MNQKDQAQGLFGRMAALADPVRARLLLVLEGHELGVTELCAIFQLPQSTMSRHLKALGDEGWIVSWSEGRSTRHRLIADRLEPSAQRLWKLVREQASALPAARQDAERVRSVLVERRSRSQEFFSTAAGEWDRLRSELFGRRADLVALPGLLDERWVVGDLGCGTGQISKSLSPFVARVVAVDESPEMLAAARERLEGSTNVDVRRGTLEELPIGDGELDAAVLFLVLHYLAEPALGLREAARALKPGGRLLIVDMTPHEREEYRQRMGHLWQGFTAADLEDWLTEVGFARFRHIPLQPDPEAKGPGLFAATAVKLK